MKVCVQYCHGLCNPVTTAARLACYLVVEQTMGPTRADLGCGPALEAGVSEDVEFIERDPVVAVECCEECCTSRLVERFGSKVVKRVMAHEELIAAGFDPHSLQHDQLHLDHPAVVELARRITQAAEEALGCDQAQGRRG